MSLKIYVNGEMVAAAEAKISVFDSGFNFADGVFEGIRVYQGNVVRLREHVRRLFGSARAFAIRMPFSPDEFEREVVRWLKANDRQIVGDKFHFRPIVTRGNRNPPRLDPKFVQSRPNVVIVGGKIEPPTNPAGLSLMISSLRRPSSDVLDAKIKSLNYGNNLLARLEAQAHGYDDALMLDQQGFIAEASAANLFMVIGRKLYTPFPKACLDGITRAMVLEIAAERGVDASERDLTAVDLKLADEAFVTGTGTGIMFVGQVDKSPVGSGAEGPVTTMVREAYAKAVLTQGVTF